MSGYDPAAAWQADQLADCEDKKIEWRVRARAAEAKLAAIQAWRQRYVDYGNEDPWTSELDAILDGSGT